MKPKPIWKVVAEIGDAVPKKRVEKSAERFSAKPGSLFVRGEEENGKDNN